MRLLRSPIISLEFIVLRPGLFISTFMYEKMSSGKIRSFGISRLKMGFFALLIAFGGLLAVTKYLDLSIVVKDSMDQGVIKAVRQGIAEYAERSRERNSTLLYPPVLDDAKIGKATPHNLFFSNVLQRGIAVEGWAKIGQYEYRTPRGEKLIYDPRTGDLQTHGSMTASTMDHSTPGTNSDADYETPQAVHSPLTPDPRDQ